MGLKTLLCGGKPQGDMGKPSLICTQNWEIMMKVLNIHQKKCDLTGFINSETGPWSDDFLGVILASSLVPLQLLAGSFLEVKFFPRAYVLVSLCWPSLDDFLEDSSLSTLVSPHVFLRSADFFGNQLIEVLQLAWCCWSPPFSPFRSTGP